MKVQPNAFIEHALSVKEISARFCILHLKECSDTAQFVITMASGSSGGDV